MAFSFICALLLGLGSSVWANEPESVGPRSEEETQFLLRESREAFDSGRADDAARLLKRLVSRYPSHPEMAKSQLLLGKSLTVLGKPKEAIPHLLRAIEAWGNQPDGVAARLPLGRAYLAAADPRAALVVVRELTQGPAGKKASAEVLSEALQIQAYAHLALKKETDARRDLHSLVVSAAAANTAGQPLPPTILAETAWLELKLKSNECARLPAPGRMEEGQARVQMERRGTCVQEAVLFALRTADAEPLAWAPKAAASLSDILKGFERACRNPPVPPGARSSTQLKKYRQELVQHLLPLCEKAWVAARASIPDEHVLRKAFEPWADLKK